MAKVITYGIKFPISVESGDNTLFDMAHSEASSVNSRLMHLIFTPKGQRLRDPMFGTNLIQYIFNPNDEQLWEDVVNEIKEVVKNYIPDCSITDIDVHISDDGNGIYIKTRYEVKENGGIASYETITKL